MGFTPRLFLPFLVQIHDVYILMLGCSSLCRWVSASYNEVMITLLNVPNGKRARLISVSERLRTKLMQYGLHNGDFVRVLRSAPLGGPLLVETNGREIALGRTVAEKIWVELE